MSETIEDELQQELQDGMRELDLSVNDSQIEAFITYLKLLEKWNTSFNLSGVDDIHSMVARHLLDSVAISPYLDGKNIVDVGTGAGLPGIPLAIMHPEKHFTLIDSNGKKTRFLFQVKIALKIDNISIENTRIEHYQSQQQIDMVMCRAFSSLEDMAHKLQQLLTDDCTLLAMKGRYPEQELNSLPEGFEVARVIKLEIPGSESERHLVVMTRTKKAE